MSNPLLQAIKWDSNGLVCAITQDIQSKKILMVAWMNAEALQKTVETGYVHYYSRSRQKQWLKGEESGHTQKVHSIRLDCDGDALLISITQNGGIACHTGRESCFYQEWDGTQWQTREPILKNEHEIYQKNQ